MSDQNGEQGQVLDANTASDEDVNQALGLGEQQDDGQESESKDSEEFTDLPDFWQKEVNRLRRENAAARVKARQATRATPESQEDQGKDLGVAIKRAQDEAKAEARMEYGAKLAAAEVKAALTGVVPDSSLDDIVDDLNMGRYVDDEGEVDKESVAALRDKYKSMFDGRRRNGAKPNTAASSSPKAKTPQAEFEELLNQL